jgi:type II secretory pathway pseudopilin PulG
MSFCRAGFTLLEICLALAIGVLLILLAVPSVSGLLAEQRLKQSFERFDQLVAAAVNRSVAERRDYAMVWERQNIRVLPLERKDSPGADASEEGMKPLDGEHFQIQFPTELGRRSAAQWVFWSNGTCEPTIVDYHGAAGSWEARYDPLTAHGTFVRSSIR